MLMMVRPLDTDDSLRVADAEADDDCQKIRDCSCSVGCCARRPSSTADVVVDSGEQQPPPLLLQQIDSCYLNLPSHLCCCWRTTRTTMMM